MTKPRVRVSTADGMTNLVANLGTRRDKRSHNQFTGSFFYNWYELEAAYSSNWIARQIVTVPIDDGVREWRTWLGESADVMWKIEKKLKVKSAFQEASHWARLYGGAGIIMITDQPINEPLDLNRIKRDSLRRLVVLDRNDLIPLEMVVTDPTDANYLNPEWYQINGGSSLVHHSHVVRIDGERLPRRMQQENQGWGDSSLRRIMEDLKDVTATKGGIASLVLEANVDVIQREGLSDELASGEEDAIAGRYALAGQMKSLINTLLLDGSETYQRQSLTFSGLSQILEQFMVWVSGAADIPMTRLFGTSAQGLNATGEGDMRNYYDSVRAMQSGYFTNNLEPLDEVLWRSAGLTESPDYQWNPLFQASGVELAQAELARAQSDDIRLNQRVVSRAQVAQNLDANGVYSYTDEEIEEMKKADAEEAGYIDPFAEVNSAE